MSDSTANNKPDLSLHDAEILTCIFSSEQPLGSDDSDEVSSATSNGNGTEHSSNEIPEPPPSDEAKRFFHVSIRISIFNPQVHLT